MSKIQNNQELVPLMGGFSDGDCAFDQPCVFGYRVEGHSVYCDSKNSVYRKCHHSWYYGRSTSIIDKCADENCKYFKPNPDYQEDKEKLKIEIEQTKEQRNKDQKQLDQWNTEGWLCHRCWFGLPMKGEMVICGNESPKVWVKKCKDFKEMK